MSLKIFISYSHENENDKKEFIKHLSPLVDKKDIEIWHDREMLLGEIFEDKIKNEISQADIICLMISAGYLNSTSCKFEKKLAFDIKKKRGIDIVPIIISDCGWKDYADISSILAPIDGRPIYDHDNKNKAWNLVYEELKKLIQNAKSVSELNLSDNHKNFLNNADLLTNAHADRRTIFLEDIFVYPNLTKMDEYTDKEKIIDGEIFIDEFYDNRKILLAGEDQSGKTALCKKIYSELHKNKFIPIYLKDTKFEGKIETIIRHALDRQYENKINFDYEKNINKIVLIVDDFHIISNKDKFMKKISYFHNQIIIVDDIFTFNLKEETLTKQYSRYRIKPYGPKRRDMLIRKWIGMNKEYSAEDNYKLIDKKTELVNNLFRKIMGNGGIQSYPFFILSSLNIFEIANNKLDTEITSQGYCYQTLIYLCLKKENVRNEDIDAYINFLSEAAIYLFDKNLKETIQIDFDVFLKSYKENYNSYIDDKILLDRLHKSKIFSKNCLGNYAFEYDYIFYYFVAKYLSEHINDNRMNMIEDMINNLHKNENAYILIFLFHHAKNDEIINKLLKTAESIFDFSVTATTLKKSELKFVDENIKHIAEAVLPNNLNPEKEREKRLSIQQDTEDGEEPSDNNSNNDLILELRKGIKTIEVIGQIAKNRAGSMKKQKIREILMAGIGINLRIITFFLNSIAKQDEQYQIIDLISARLKLFLRHKNKNIGDEQLKKVAEKLFWNFIFGIIYGFINNAIHSLGSDKLLDIISELYDENKTPAYCLLKHGIFMWYGKNLQSSVIKDELENKEFSETAKKVMRYLVVNHCLMHKISYKEKQKIEIFLKISAISLQEIKFKNKNS